MWNKIIENGMQVENFISNEHQKRFDLLGAWRSISEVELPVDGAHLYTVHLLDKVDGVYHRCRCIYDDLEPISYPRSRHELIETRGSLVEAVQKGSLFGAIIEIDRCGDDLYCAYYER